MNFRRELGRKLETVKALGLLHQLSGDGGDLIDRVGGHGLGVVSDEILLHPGGAVHFDA